METPNLDTISRFLRRLRERLTNFSRRNKELYYKHGPLSLNLTQNPYKDILIQENKFEEQFISQFDVFSGLRINSSSLTTLLREGEINLNELFLFQGSTDIQSVLHREIESRRAILNQRLNRIRSADRKFQREYGISGAWLLGPFLCWRSSNDYADRDLIITPVLRVPIDLTQNKQKVWKLELETQDILLNPSLRLLIRNSWGIELPEKFDTDSLGEGIKQLIRLVKEGGKEIILKELDDVPKIPPRKRVIKDDDGNVISEEMISLDKELNSSELEIYKQTTSEVFTLIDCFHISQINASKMALVEDYDKIIDDAREHPIISELLLGQSRRNDTQTKLTPRTLDSYKESHNHFVVEIDSTQHRAVDFSIKESAIAIQGPPGTGKSQTITNLIASQVADGKKVLFVSEKRAALDVVFTRLRKAEIADQALLLHSSDLNKSELYKSFVSLVDVKPEPSIMHEWQLVCSDLDHTKKEINSLYDCLSKYHSESGLTVSDICSLFAMVGEVNIDLIVCEFIGNISFNNLERLVSGLNEIQSLALKINDLPNHPWLRKKSTVAATSVLKSAIENIDHRCHKLCVSLDALNQRLSGLVKNFQDSAFDNFDYDEELLRGIQTLINTSNVCFVKLSLCLNANKDFQDTIEKLEIALRENYDSHTSFNHDAEYEDIKLLWSYFRIDRGLFDWFSSEFRRNRRLARTLLKDKSSYRNKNLYNGYLAYCDNFETFVQILDRVGYSATPSVFDNSKTLEAITTIHHHISAHLHLSQLRQQIEGDTVSTIWEGSNSAIEFVTKLIELKSLLNDRKSFIDQIRQVREEGVRPFGG